MEILNTLNTKLILFGMVFLLLIVWIVRLINLWFLLERIVGRKKRYEIITQYSKNADTEKNLFYNNEEIEKHNRLVKKFLKLYGKKIRWIPVKSLLKILSSYTYDKRIPLLLEGIVVILSRKKITHEKIMESLKNAIPCEKQRIQRLLQAA